MLSSCNAAADVKNIIWYINDKILTTSPASSPVFFKPEEGEIKISCSDDKGRNADVWIEVRYF